MPGDPDPLYVLARRMLLDGLAALGPVLLATTPSIIELLNRGGFELQDDPGMWLTSDRIQVDLLVPESLAGPGRRGASLPGHGRRVARRAKGIEGVLVDSAVREVGALDPADSRSFQVAVAGPAALFVAKLHKIAERLGQPDRLVEKDALDVLRLLRAAPTDELAQSLCRLTDHELSRGVAIEAIDLANRLLVQDGAPGQRMAARAAGGLEDPVTIEVSMQILAADLLAAVERQRQQLGLEGDPG